MESIYPKSDTNWSASKYENWNQSLFEIVKKELGRRLLQLIRAHLSLKPKSRVKLNHDSLRFLKELNWNAWVVNQISIIGITTSIKPIKEWPEDEFVKIVFTLSAGVRWNLSNSSPIILNSVTVLYLRAGERAHVKTQLNQSSIPITVTKKVCLYSHIGTLWNSNGWKLNRDSTKHIKTGHFFSHESDGFVSPVDINERQHEERTKEVIIFHAPWFSVSLHKHSDEHSWYCWGYRDLC